MASQTDIAWAAGLFEGEGCLYEQKSGQRRRFPYLGLTIEMKDEDIVRRFAAVMADVAGNRSKVTTRWRGNVNHSRQYALKMGGSCAELAFLAMRPYLGERRTARGDEILERRREAIEAAREFRTCWLPGCEVVFEVPLASPLKRFCSSRCAHRGKVRTPELRAAQNERSRRYKERQRAISGTVPHSIK